MILYHGSNTVVRDIDLSKSKPNKDFGRGFYLSETEEQAYEMAKVKTLILGGDIIVNRYEFDEKAMSSSDLNALIFNDYSEEWLDFILYNRSTKNPHHKYDIVYGPIANDKVGAQIIRYKDKNIDKKELLQRLKYIKGITFQYYFGTEQAISYLKAI